MPIIIDLIPVNETIIATLDLARQYNLAAYDAAYLELAMREKLLLATTDNRLANAAKNLNLLLEDPNV
ncbi:type II toxin-antitoxin system VapC family toxin [Sphaerospermopsis aphanizomenoides]|uniref:type II toxin-antitoxin system VapC family toxin n=1 Tax=Sphaerospermopsis aphanizomenoides TaxID=459663 RepID=UPI001D1328F8|nr:type II toxin-antitoxin system VapC family toxin [Sphaerospermopsis aphanizomenoides]